MENTLTKYQDWTRNFFLLVAILLAMTGWTVFIIDPFNMENGSPLKYDRKKVNGLTNTSLWAIISVDRVTDEIKRKSNVVIIGDSRGEDLTKTDVHNVTFRAGRDQILNLSFGGSSLEEMISLFDKEYAKGDLARVQKIIITVPFRRFIEEQKPNKIDEASLLVANRFSYYFNYNMLKRSFMSIAGIISKGKQSTTSPEEKEEKLIYTVADMVRRVNGDLFESRLNTFAQWASGLTESGIEIILWAPPVKTSLVHAVKQNDNSEMYQRYAAVMDKTAKFHDMFARPDIYDLNFEFNAGDPVHSGQAESILKILLE